MRVFVIPNADDSEAHLQKLGISKREMVCCDINAGLRIWSDFGILDDGYGRLLVAAGDVEDGERGRIIQRVQELGNYRNLALLGFPAVQQYGPQVDELKRRLSEHAKRITVADYPADLRFCTLFASQGAEGKRAGKARIADT